MKPITGSVVSSKPVSLSKAASILSRFVASDTGAHQDFSAFLHRTSEAIDELARFHRELGAQREVPGGRDGEVVERRKKERKKKEGAVLEAARDGSFKKIEGKRRKKKEVEGTVEAAQDGSFAGIGSDRETSAGRHRGDALELGESKSGSREKRRVAKEVESGVGIVVEMGSEKCNKIELKRPKDEDTEMGRAGEEDGGDHSERRRKKKRKKEADVKEESGDWVENHVEREADDGDHSERRQKKKRKKVEDVKEECRDWVENHVEGKGNGGDHSERRQKKKIKKGDVKKEVGDGVEYHVELHHRKKMKVKEEH